VRLNLFPILHKASEFRSEAEDPVACENDAEEETTSEEPAPLPLGDDVPPSIEILRKLFDRAHTFIVSQGNTKTTMSRTELKCRYASAYLRWLEEEAFGGTVGLSFT
jgi:hypothetical protein